MAVLENHWIAEQARENDRLADEDDRIEELRRALYFDAFTELSNDGKLADPHLHQALEEAVFCECPKNTHLDAKEVFRLVGEYHQSSSLNLERRKVLDLRLAKYVREVVEKHLGKLVDAKAGGFA